MKKGEELLHSKLLEFVELAKLFIIIMQKVSLFVSPIVYIASSKICEISFTCANFSSIHASDFRSVLCHAMPYVCDVADESCVRLFKQ